MLRSDLGQCGWDPVCFATDEAKAYLFPAMARFAMAPPLWSGHDWYGDQFLFHLTSGGEYHSLLAYCSHDQRSAVKAVLKWIAENRIDELDDALTDDLLRALDLWR